MSRKIVRVDQSPMNPKRWCLQLECGHEAWVTAKRRPTRSTARCPVCDPPIPQEDSDE